MKLLTKEEERAHYNATLKGGTIGGITGLAVGALGVVGASRRYPHFNQLTLPLKAFLITSAGTFAGIITADHYSRKYEEERNPLDQQYKERQKQQAADEKAGLTFTQRAMEFGKKERYKIVGASWVASMFAAFSIVNRNKYLTGAQKLVQARVYAQFLTLGVLVASAAFEISDRNNEEGRWETVKYVDPHDPEHKRMLEKKVEKPEKHDSGDELWRDMVDAEEERLKQKDREIKYFEDQERKKRKKDHRGKAHEEGSKKEAKKAEKEDIEEEKQKAVDTKEGKNKK